MRKLSEKQQAFVDGVLNGPPPNKSVKERNKEIDAFIEDAKSKKGGE